MVERLPIFKGGIYNTTKAENTDFFATDLLPTHAPSTFIIYYYASGNGTGGLPSLKRTNGSNIVMENFPIQFTTSAQYMFQVLVGPDDSINFKMPSGSGSCGIATLMVVETEITTSHLIFNAPRLP